MYIFGCAELFFMFYVFWYCSNLVYCTTYAKNKLQFQQIQ